MRYSLSVQFFNHLTHPTNNPWTQPHLSPSLPTSCGEPPAAAQDQLHRVAQRHLIHQGPHGPARSRSATWRLKVGRESLPPHPRPKGADQRSARRASELLFTKHPSTGVMGRLQKGSEVRKTTTIRNSTQMKHTFETCRPSHNPNIGLLCFCVSCFVKLDVKKM